MELVAGRYELITELGQGGFGCVHLAREPESPDSLWALKEIDFTEMGAKEAEALWEFFDREQKILSWLSHPNIAQRKEVLIEAAHIYLVMEYVEGADLSSVLREHGGSLSPGAIVGLGEHICDILLYLHTQKPYPIVFRDLKPSNLMLTTSGSVKLIDFGIARVCKPPGEEAAGASKLLASLGAATVLGDAGATPAQPAGLEPTAYLGTLTSAPAPIPFDQALEGAQPATQWLGTAGPPRPGADHPPETAPAGLGATEWLGTLPQSAQAQPGESRGSLAPTAFLGTAPPRAKAVQEDDSICLGTPGYAAPEQYPGSGLRTDPRADIYALGVMLYQFLSRQNPAHLQVPLPPLRTFNPSVHPELEQIIARATAPDREQRYPSVRQLSQALADFRQSRLLLSPQGVARELKSVAARCRPPRVVPPATRPRPVSAETVAKKKTSGTGRLPTVPRRLPARALGAGAVVVVAALALWPIGLGYLSPVVLAAAATAVVVRRRRGRVKGSGATRAKD